MDIYHTMSESEEGGRSVLTAMLYYEHKGRCGQLFNMNTCFTGLLFVTDNAVEIQR